MRRIHEKDWLILLFDVLAVNLSYFLALVLRFYLDTGMRLSQSGYEYLTMFAKFAPVYTVICIVVFYWERLYGGMWRFAGINDMNRIIKASLITTFFQVAGTITIFARRMPISYYLIGAVLQFTLIMLTRFGYRLWLVEMRVLSNRRKTGKNSLIVGTGEAARFMIREIESSDEYRPTCLLDIKSKYDMRTLDGIPVYGGLEQIETLISRHEIKYVFIAEPLMQPGKKEEIEQICNSRKIGIRDYSYQIYSSVDEEGESVKGAETEQGKTHKIPFSPPDISGTEVREVTEALRSGWITTGPRVKMLERRLAAFIISGHTDIDTETDSQEWINRVVCLSSATAAEELNLRVLGIHEGDEVIVPAYTYTATASAAIHCGATVKFVDIQKDGNPLTHMPEPDYGAIEAAITPATKAIVMVDLAGIPADYDKVFEIVERKKDLFKPAVSDGTPLGDLASKIQQGLGWVAVVSDSAHALGASRMVRCTGRETMTSPAKRYCGRIAHFTSFSFHAVKNFTTAEGGAATWCLPQSVYDNGVSDAELYHMYQLLSLHGQSKDAFAKTNGGAWEYDVVGPWYKCNMTDIMGAIGLRQLDRYQKMLDRRREIVRQYDKVCDEIGLFHLIHHTDEVDSSNHLYLVRIPGYDEDKRNKVIEYMAGEGVSTNVHYKPLPMMSAYSDLGWDIKDFPSSFDYYKNLFTLPLHTLLTDDDVEYIIAKLRQIKVGS